MNWLFRVWMAVAQIVRATRSPLIKAPAYRVLFLLVVAGVLLICMLPEAAFVLPTFDALGLDIVTILVALELRHYILVLMRLAGVPTCVNGFRSGIAPLLSRCLSFMIAPTKPEMLPYACTWILIAFRIVMGSMKVPPQVQG
jgi:hypothetical protein